MLTILIAALVVFIFTTVLTIAGVGAAFILIPAFYWLGIPLREAMAVALLLNSISMIFASRTYIKHKLVVFKTSIPIIIIAVIFSPLGAYCSQFVNREVLLWLFIGFLVFAGSMMMFYHAKEQEKARSAKQELAYGLGVGTLAGFLGGLLGVGGGNIIVPVLIWLGFDPKKASGTTAFIVIFSSFAGFLGHASFGNINWQLLLFAAIASIAGAILGAHLMHAKLKSRQVKWIIGLVLYAIALKMIWGLVF
ncbi:MAG: sulfite exporter TauE/SafE family protein [Candidatus Neomarinimicrobiota bacterium]|nr:MAG: sulfite exporter TauE/SafE family protein [Candidatus Neomarinimicrobiota bacterium]